MNLPETTCVLLCPPGPETRHRPVRGPERWTQPHLSAGGSLWRDAGELPPSEGLFSAVCNLDYFITVEQPNLLSGDPVIAACVDSLGIFALLLAPFTFLITAQISFFFVFFHFGAQTQTFFLCLRLLTSLHPPTDPFLLSVGSLFRCSFF